MTVNSFNALVSHNPVTLARELIRCPSVTPLDAGALDLVQSWLEPSGFVCTRESFGQGNARVDNLYARWGVIAPNFCFAGHTDVVPVGDITKWDSPPFEAVIDGGILRGRGAADMKGAIAAFVAAVMDLFESGWRPEGSISFLITGDEEGPAIDGTKKLLQTITEMGESIDHCIVGEPTNPNVMGERVKNGRRGSMNAKLTVRGTQGHVAYPHRASNPVPVLMHVLNRLTARTLDEGNAHFQASNLEVTSIDVGNSAHNIIPETARAMFNIRFNTEHGSDDLKAWINNLVADVQAGFDGQIEADLEVTGEAFLTRPCEFTTLVQDSVEAVTGQRPSLSTSGGTSDARFITNYAPVVEFGGGSATIHQVNEHEKIENIQMLKDIYQTILTRYFA